MKTRKSRTFCAWRVVSQNNGYVCVHAGEDMIAAVKGAVVIPHGMNRPRTCDSTWALTAEHGGGEPETGISDLTFEWIIDGTVVKLKQGKTDYVLPDIWDQMADAIEQLKPHTGDQFSIADVDSTTYGIWTLEGPDEFMWEAFQPGLQVTTALPMAAIYGLINTVADGEDNVVLPASRTKTRRLVQVTEEDLEEHYTDDSTLDDATLGFFSLLMSYVKLATRMDSGNRESGPKQLLFIMPRTSWNKLYELYGTDHDQDESARKRKCKKRRKDKRSLLDIVDDLAKKKGIENAGSATFKWHKQNNHRVTTYPGISTSCTPQNQVRRALEMRANDDVDINTDWPAKDTDVERKELAVETWVKELENGKDVLAVMDRLVWDGQIGGFGSRTEGPLTESSSEEELGLFELRDISVFGYGRDSIRTKLLRIEEQIKGWHDANSQARKKRSLLCKKPGFENQDCKGNQVPNILGKCEDCEKGFKPNKQNTKCIPGSPEDNDDGKQGKCKDKDFILDPAQGGQEENTENPICTYDDDKKCKQKGQTAVTRTPNNKVEPKDADAYQPSVDQTRHAKQQLRERYNQRVESARKQKEKTKEARKEERRTNSRRTRMGLCFTLLAGLQAWDLAEIEAMPGNDMAGMLELWPEDGELKYNIPIHISDYKITVTHKQTKPIVVIIGGDSSLAGGFPFLGLLNAAGRVLSPITRISGGASRVYTSVRSGKTGKASAEAIKSARSSGTVGKILKDQRFLDCLAATPAVIAQQAGKPSKRDDGGIVEILYPVDEYWNVSIKFDPTAPYYDPKIPPPEFDDRHIELWGRNDAPGLFEAEIELLPLGVTYPDQVRRENRLLYETCMSVPTVGNTLTAAAVVGGCCAFYADSDCNYGLFLFAMTNRTDLRLRGEDNDNVEAVWCTFDELCKNAPGPPQH
ncbi:uncharacterized protein EI97DRAFT_439857 [Westerdykella ornata]|uniref:Uncharacterized protein n=1 Tax=Westerdykella ornata TaxID=318751 RepID=A0A6A6JTU4_WESOR|nr:uncharacterized protein EI97DRAFT_439857 [Westerdykella ornata]KAF2279523.1 hypothetical protein EI97DRAFT_439857 [Westerdykella ornata]